MEEGNTEPEQEEVRDGWKRGGERGERIESLGGGQEGGGG